MYFLGINIKTNNTIFLEPFTGQFQCWFCEIYSAFGKFNCDTCRHTGQVTCLYLQLLMIATASQTWRSFTRKLKSLSAIIIACIGVSTSIVMQQKITIMTSKTITRASCHRILRICMVIQDPQSMAICRASSSVSELIETHTRYLISRICSLFQPGNRHNNLWFMSYFMPLHLFSNLILKYYPEVIANFVIAISNL